MSVALLGVVSPNAEVSNSFGEGNRLLDSSKFTSRNKNSLCSGRIKKGKIPRSSSCSFSTNLRFSCLGQSGLENGGRFSIHSSMVVNPAGEMVGSSEQKVYDVVLKQAALVKRQLRSDDDLEVKPDIILPGTLGLLSEAYDRCGEVCAEYAKTFYLG